MSTYTVTTNFTLKDSLPSGDPAKIIKGIDFGTEFSNIATAVNDNVSDISALVSDLQDKADKTNPTTFNTHTHTGSTTISGNFEAGTGSGTNPVFEVSDSLNFAQVYGGFIVSDGGDFTMTGGGDFNISSADRKYFGTRVQPFKMQTDLAESWRLLTYTNTSGDLSGLTGGNNGGIFCVGSGGVGLGFNTFSGSYYVMPYDFDANATKANLINLGSSSSQFKNIYLTNSPVISSDESLKQDIRKLTEAEQRVAQTCRGLLRAYRWKSRVEEEGDAARIHVGIIAQELKAAFEAEGLDATRYSMFIEGTGEDEEGNEQPKKLAVRYEQLLAFIISAL